MSTNTWNGFKMEEFLFEDRKAIIVFPNEGTSNGKMLLKTEYWGAFPDAEIKLVGKGFHLVFVKNQTRLATKAECDLKARFVKHVAKKYGLSEKCIPVGMSCGGAYAVKFAGYYPELVRCMYIDAPVLNFCDFPGSLTKAGYEKYWNNEFTVAYPGVKRYQLLNFAEHPINMVDILIENKIPILMVYGTQDLTVTYEENGKLLEEAYEGHEGLLTVIPVSARGHHPHGLLTSPDPIVEYIVENSK